MHRRISAVNGLRLGRFVLHNLPGLFRRYHFFNRTFDEHLVRLDEVFRRIGQANLKLKPSKCSICQRKVEFLGHIVSATGIAMQPDKVEAVRTWPKCENVTEVRALPSLVLVAITAGSFETSPKLQHRCTTC